MIPKLIAFLRANLAPNRVAIYLTTIADIAGLVIVLAGDLGLPQVGAVVATIAAVNAKALVFVKGQQNFETALYQRDLIAFKSNTEADALSRAVEAQAAVSRPTGIKKLDLPR